jgi:hypothetical protein
MVDAGVDRFFFIGACILVQGDMVLAKVVRLGALYKLDATTQVMDSGSATSTKGTKSMTKLKISSMML